MHRELARPSVTLLLLWNEYVAKCGDAGEVPYRYSFFNEQYRRWVKATGASMRIARDPGESIEVDWAGDAMVFADPLTGEPCQAWLFVAALSYSAYTYVEAFADMTLASWIDTHVPAFEAFEGVARLLVPDNLRTGISKADRYEPALEHVRLPVPVGPLAIPAVTPGCDGIGSGWITRIGEIYFANRRRQSRESAKSCDTRFQPDTPLRPEVGDADVTGNTAPPGYRSR